MAVWDLFLSLQMYASCPPCSWCTSRSSRWSVWESMEWRCSGTADCAGCRWEALNSLIWVDPSGVPFIARRINKSWFIQIATKRTVYLFDILLLGARAFKNGLTMILENRDILKVRSQSRLVHWWWWSHLYWFYFWRRSFMTAEPLMDVWRLSLG